MKKQELIHLHGLLVEVASRADPDTEGSVPLSQYESLGTRPTSIHRSKQDHKEAVFALTDDITTSIDAQHADSISVSSD